LGDLLLQLAHCLEGTVAQLPIDIGATSQYLQMIAQEHIVIFASCHLQEVSACHRLWNLDSVESGKDLRTTLSSSSGHWHLSS
jgi:hypothetical protein